MEKKVPEKNVNMKEEDVFYVYEKRINKCVREDCEGVVKYGLNIKVNTGHDETINCFECNKCHMKYTPYPNYNRLKDKTLSKIYNEADVKDWQEHTKRKIEIKKNPDKYKGVKFGALKEQINQEKHPERKPYHRADGQRNYDRKPYDRADGQRNYDRKPYDRADGQRNYDRKPYDRADGQRNYDRKPYDRADGQRSYDRKPYDRADGQRNYDRKPYDRADGQNKFDKKPYDKTRKPYQAKAQTYTVKKGNIIITRTVDQPKNNGMQMKRKPIEPKDKKDES